MDYKSIPTTVLQENSLLNKNLHSYSLIHTVLIENTNMQIVGKNCIATKILIYGDIRIYNEFELNKCNIVCVIA